MTREDQFFTHEGEYKGKPIVRLYAMTAGEPELLYSSTTAANVARMRARLLASLKWSDNLELQKLL